MGEGAGAERPRLSHATRRFRRHGKLSGAFHPDVAMRCLRLERVPEADLPGWETRLTSVFQEVRNLQDTEDLARPEAQKLANDAREAMTAASQQDQQVESAEDFDHRKETYTKMRDEYVNNTFPRPGRPGSATKNCIRYI